MKLYGFPASTNTWLVRAVAAQLDFSLDFQMVDLMKGEARSPDFLKLNPTGRVPVLTDGDFSLWEANAIIQYIASQTPNSLYPENVQTRAYILQWQSWQLAHWSLACQPIQYENFVKPQLKMGEPDAEALAQATERFHKEAKMLDQHLVNRKYLVGDELTIADFAVASYLAYSGPARFPLEPYGNIRRWFEQISVLPAWRNSAPQM
jgi:glutathione S-transferase